jgi:hypothetical protein
MRVASRVRVFVCESVASEPAAGLGPFLSYCWKRDGHPSPASRINNIVLWGLFPALRLHEADLGSL